MHWTNRHSLHKKEWLIRFSPYKCQTKEMDEHFSLIFLHNCCPRFQWHTNDWTKKRYQTCHVERKMKRSMRTITTWEPQTKALLMHVRSFISFEETQHKLHISIFLAHFYCVRKNSLLCLLCRLSILFFEEIFVMTNSFRIIFFLFKIKILFWKIIFLKNFFLGKFF